MNKEQLATFARYGYDAYNMYNDARKYSGSLRGSFGKYPAKRKGLRRRRYSGLTRSVGTHSYIRRSPPLLFALNSSSGITTVNSTTLASANPGFALTFQLGSVNIIVGTNSSIALNLTSGDLTSLYDQYRIDKVCIDMYWSNNTSSNTNSVALPILQTAIDYDDIVAPTGANVLTQFSTFKIDGFGDGNKTHFRHSFIPKVSEATTTSNVGGSAGTVLASRQFINTETAGVAHTGFKGWFDYGNSINNSDGVVSLYITYKLTMKLVK